MKFDYYNSYLFKFIRLVFIYEILKLDNYDSY